MVAFQRPEVSLQDTQDIHWEYDQARGVVKSSNVITERDAREVARTVNDALERTFGGQAVAVLGEENDTRQMRATNDRNTVVVRNVTAGQFTEATGAPVADAQRKGAAAQSA